MKNYRLHIISLIFCLIFANACSSAQVKNTTRDAAAISEENKSVNTEIAESREENPQANDIRKVDFKNFTYKAYCGGEQTNEADTIEIPVKKGELENVKLKGDTYERDNESLPNYFEVDSVKYGDITGDGKDEAVIRTLCNTGGTGQFSEGFVYTMKNGKPALLTRVEGGDRGYGGLQDIRVEKGLVVVEQNNPGETGGNCCAAWVDITKYRLSGGKLVQVGKPTKRDVIPAKRISFAKGKSESVFSVKFSPTEIKHYVVRAQAGQTITFSTNANPPSDVSLALMNGEGESAENGSGIVVKTKENGDYVFEMVNSSDKDLNVFVTIAIQ
jgi:hypothetical protein